MRLISSVLEWLHSLLGFFVNKSSATDTDTATKKDSSTTIEVVSKIPKKASTSLKEEAPKWGKFLQPFVLDRWQWVRYNFWVVVVILIFIAIAYFSENDTGSPWWTDFWESAKLWFSQTWEARPVTVALVGLLLFLFLFGIDWLRQLDNWLLRFWQWAKAHRQISTTIGALLIILIFYILTNANTWAFTSVEVWSEEKSGLSGNEIAIQFRGNLNAIGTTSFEALTVSVPNPPAIVTNAKSNLNPLSLDDCQQILIGPKSFVASSGRSPVSLPRLSRAEADDGTAGQISLGTTLGSFNLPLQGFFRLIYSYTSPNYRELSAQIVPASRTSDADAIRIIVTAIDGNRWTVEGSRENLPQLVNFLTYRIALDWKAEQTKQAADLVESADLALTLGNQAFAARDFPAALAYYQLAEWFRSDSATIEVMLGLTQLQLSRVAADEAEKRALLDKASRAFNQASTLDPNNADLYPYLACLYQLANDKQSAGQQLEAFNTTLAPDNPDAKQERITELDKKPPLGPGRRLSTYPTAETFDLYYISDDAAHFALDLPYNNPELTFQPITAGEAPRQIFAVADGAYYVTADGLVNFFRPGTPTDPAEIIPVIDTTNLQLAVLPTGELELGTFPINDESDLNVSQMGGIRQIFAEGDLLFLLDRFGRIVRLRVSPSGTGGLDPIPEAVSNADARQIFLDTNALYLLKEDGTIWRISEPRTGNLQTARQLVSDTDNREITAANGVVYMLRTNGNIWRYRDGEGTEEDSLKRIDGGVETSRIYIDNSHGLFVLKTDGITWLIGNPQNPGPNDIGRLNLPLANRVAINSAGPNLITLERTESTAPEVKLYQDFSAASNTMANQVAQVPMDDTLLPTSTAIPTPTPAPSPTTPPSPTPTNTPPPPETPTPQPQVDTIAPAATIVAQNPLAKTRAVDDAAEVLIKSSDDEAGWYWIDQTEVTNEQYLTCVEVDEVCTPNQEDYAEWFYQEGHPVVGVNWQQAQTYCEWVGGSLPTVSQWRTAASPDGRVYPWGDAGPSCQLAAINDACDDDPLGTRIVGSKPDGASPAGILDLIGNVWEWTATLGNKDDARVTLGGSWSNPDGTAEGGFNAFNPANTISQGEERQIENLGFRCVRPYQPSAQ